MDVGSLSHPPVVWLYFHVRLLSPLIGCGACQSQCSWTSFTPIVSCHTASERAYDTNFPPVPTRNPWRRTDRKLHDYHGDARSSILFLPESEYFISLLTQRSWSSKWACWTSTQMEAASGSKCQSVRHVTCSPWQRYNVDLLSFILSNHLILVWFGSWAHSGCDGSPSRCMSQCISQWKKWKTVHFFHFFNKYPSIYSFYWYNYFIIIAVWVLWKGSVTLHFEGLIG